MKLREFAHSRAGDKGDTSTISVIARDPADYEWLRATVTVERVRAHFTNITVGQITRFEVPGIAALNFVLEGALKGGVTRSLAIDGHGKCLGGILLAMEVDAP